MGLLQPLCRQLTLHIVLENLSDTDNVSSFANHTGKPPVIIAPIASSMGGQPGSCRKSRTKEVISSDVGGLLPRC